MVTGQQLSPWAQLRGARASASPIPAPPVLTSSSLPTAHPTSTSTEVPINTHGLSPELLRRLRLAQAAASKQGITITVKSGWRSLAEQEQLYEEQIAELGEAEAKRRVLPPSQSEHPRGRAIDVAPLEAGAWLTKNGWRYGLCQRYANEWWHFEPITMPGTPCPPKVANAAERAISR